MQVEYTTGNDNITGAYREVYFPAQNKFDANRDPKQFEEYKFIIGATHGSLRGGNLVVGAHVQLVVDRALLSIREAVESAGGPHVFHEFGFIAGSGDGYNSGLPKCINGQLPHVDILKPERQVLAYLLDGPATLVYSEGYTGSQAEDCAANWEHFSGWSLLDLLEPDGCSGKNEILEQYYGAHLLMQPKKNLIERIRPVVSGGVKAGTIAVIGGGIPHAGPGLSSGAKRLAVFCVATPSRVYKAYSGYAQIMVGELLVILGMMAKTPEHRRRCQTAAKV